MRTLGVAFGVMLTTAVPAQADEILTRPSGRSVTETLDRLQAQATEGGFTVVARVPHAKAARGSGWTYVPPRRSSSATLRAARR